jgi:hypothetical protein
MKRVCGNPCKKAFCFKLLHFKCLTKINTTVLFDQLDLNIFSVSEVFLNFSLQFKHTKIFHFVSSNLRLGWGFNHSVKTHAPVAATTERVVFGSGSLTPQST